LRTINNDTRHDTLRTNCTIRPHNCVLMSQFHKKGEKNRLKGNRDWSRVRLLARRISRVKKEKKGSRCDRVIASWKSGDLLFCASSFKKTKRTIKLHVPNVASVTEARGSYQPAGTRPAAFAFTHARKYARTDRKAGSELNARDTQRRWLLRLKWENDACRNCSTTEKKAGSRLIRAIVAVALIFSPKPILYLLRWSRSINAITNARCSSNVWPW